jgi:hypothetical protein
MVQTLLRDFGKTVLQALLKNAFMPLR